jgi:hypothetical protein
MKTDPRLRWIASKAQRHASVQDNSKPFGCGMVSTEKRKNSTRVQLQTPTMVIAIINAKTTPFYDAAFAE